MGSLRCTLCCGETFNTFAELSTHLKKILDSIFCSRCRLKFCSLKELVDHYVGEECSVIENVRKNNKSSQLKEHQAEREFMNDIFVVETDLPEPTFFQYGACLRDRSAFENAEADQKRCNSLEYIKSLHPFDINSGDDDQNKSKENISSSSKPAEKKNNEKPSEEEVNMFYCSCGMTFVSILDHLKTHHYGEEVFINENPVQLEKILNISFSKINFTVTEVPTVTVDQEFAHLEIEENGELLIIDFELAEVIVCSKDTLIPSMEGNAVVEDLMELQFEHYEEMHNNQNESVQAVISSEHLPFTCKGSHLQQGNSIDLHRNTLTDLNLDIPSHLREKSFKCAYCRKMFSDARSRLKHERTHTEEYPFMCEICGKTFRVISSLKSHRRIHTDERPYRCDICGKRYRSNTYIKHHLKLHSDEKNEKCPCCSKAFQTRIQLEEHKKTHIKPFRCTECNRSFSKLFNAKKHVQLHKKGENWFSFHCYICGASYARLFPLKNHMKTHYKHREQLVF